MKIDIDARGELCPKPVILTKKEFEKLTEGIIETRVDNEVAVTNLSKLAESLNSSYEVEKLGDKDFKITITKEGNNNNIVEENKDGFEDMTIAISSDTMGEGSEELGKILIKSFLYTVTETEPLPKTMVFYNGGVKLACEGSPVLEDIIELSKKGVEIVSCGTCLDFFEIKDKLKVGEISNMYTIYEKIKNPSKNIIIG